jgi:uncharacterized protein YjgD (DUF1641 family)
MSEWVDRIRGHAVWKLLETVPPLIDQALARENIEAAAIDSLERLRTVLIITNNRLLAVDPYLLDPRILGVLESAFTAIKNALDQFNANGNISTINSANQNADDVLGALPRSYSIENKEDLTNISSAAAHYRGEIDKYLKHALKTHREIAAAAENNSQLLSELSTVITAEKERLSTVTSEFQTQFSTGQDTRQTEFTTAQSERQNAFTASQTERQEKFSNTTVENQQQFSAAQEAKAKEFSEAEAERKEMTIALLTEYTEKLAEHNSSFAKDRELLGKLGTDKIEEVRASAVLDAQEVIAQLQKIKTDVERVAGVVGNLSLTSGHLNAANTSRNLQYVWQAITVLSLIGLIFIGITIAFPTTIPILLNHLFSIPLPAPTTEILTDTVYWRGFAARVFLALALGVLAAYASRQGDKFMEIERKNRKIALEMEAVGPFIAPLPKAMQDQFRMELGGRSFGIPEGEGARKEDPSPINLVDILKSKEVQEAFAKGFKAAQKPE